MSKVFKWIGKRAKERSTYAGVAVVASALGAHKLGVRVDQIGQIVGLVVGGGLMGAQTKD